MTELLVATKKGLFALEGEPGAAFDVTARAFPGEPVEYATRDPRTGRLLASVTSAFYGPKLFYADGPDTGWEQADGLELPEGGEDSLQRIWTIVPGVEDGVVYAGGDPGVLFESRDGGATFELNRALWEHPTRPKWMPGGGGLCLHTICTWPGEPDRLAIAISAAGVWLTDDGGATWRLPAGRPNGYRSGVAYVRGSDGRELVAVGTSGSDYSADGGETWAPVDTVGYNSVAFARGGVRAGWAVGAGGRIAKWAGEGAGPVQLRIRVRKEP
jgi:hypothetical protein